MMKVTVTKYLNVRVGKPSVNAPCYQYLAPGSEIETDGKIYKGDPYKGIDTWVRDLAGNYYWSGGIEQSLQNVLKITAAFESLINYNKLIVPAILLPNNMGAGVNIALLDSGVDVGHPDLVGAVVQSRSFVSSGATNDVWGHGTLMAGFIGGRSNRSTGIVGIAPQCSLYNYKICTDEGVVKSDAVKQCLNFLLNDQTAPTIQVINLSISLSDISLVSGLLAQLIARGTNVVVAGGNESLLKLNLTRLLAQQPGVIGVGTIEDGDYIKNGGVIPSGADCFYFNNKLTSTSSGNKGYLDVSGDSVYTALTSGLVAIANAPLSTYCHPKNSFNSYGIKPFN